MLVILIVSTYIPYLSHCNTTTGKETSANFFERKGKERKEKKGKKKEGKERKRREKKGKKGKERQRKEK